jgi:uncharacterized cupredoxin-like copper-binding protein
VIVTLADLVGSATEIAFTVTVLFAGTALGGVYVEGAPLAVVAGLTAPHAGEQAVPFWVRLQLTP